jgi:hypothetical protein
MTVTGSPRQIHGRMQLLCVTVAVSIGDVNTPFNSVFVIKNRLDEDVTSVVIYGVLTKIVAIVVATLVTIRKLVRLMSKYKLSKSEQIERYVTVLWIVIAALSIAVLVQAGYILKFADETNVYNMSLLGFWFILLVTAHVLKWVAKRNNDTFFDRKVLNPFIKWLEEERFS